jgi:hypothetical protein
MPQRSSSRYVYVALGAVLVAIVSVFAGVKIRRLHAVAVANATPTPAPGTTPLPISLVPGVSLGTPVFPNPIRMNPHNGAPVDGITCDQGGQITLAMHIHSHLALFYHGKQLQIPEYIGMAPVPPRGCIYWLHTHDGSGIIHVESPQLDAPGGGHFTLGEFFDIWGEPLTPDDVAGKRGPVTAYVNGTQWSEGLRSIPLLAHQQITLEVGEPLVRPPNYSFPFGD